MVGNLLSNAIKFTDRGGVTVTARVMTDGGLEISVADTGVGISEEHLQKIFDEFYQITEAHRSKGSGLGLAICKRLIEAMGGQIQAQSKADEGSRFTIRLPATAVILRPQPAATVRK